MSAPLTQPQLETLAVRLRHIDQNHGSVDDALHWLVQQGYTYSARHTIPALGEPEPGYIVTIERHGLCSCASDRSLFQAKYRLIRVLLAEGGMCNGESQSSGTESRSPSSRSAAQRGRSERERHSGTPKATEADEN